MGRRSGLGSFMGAVVRASARAAKQADAAQRRNERENSRQLRLQAQHARSNAQQSERERKSQEKADKESYLLDRQAEVEELTLELAQRINELEKILAKTLDIDDRIEFSSLLIKEKFPAYSVPLQLQGGVKEPKHHDFIATVKPRTLLEKTLGLKKRHERDLAKADEDYRNAMSSFQSKVSVRRLEIDTHKKQYEADKAANELKTEQRKAEVEELERQYRAGDPETIILYNDMVLDRSDYPDGFPDTHRIAYVSESKQLVVELDLPDISLVPTISEYKYVKTRDEIDEKSRKASEIADLYRNVVAQTALRTIHEIFEADQGNNVDICVFSGFVNKTDPATGKDIRPCLLSVRTDKQTFCQINLSRVEPIQCLRNLGAQVSPRPEEALAVKPLIEFSMIDPRFIDQNDILSEIDQRPNLIELSPTEFEVLVSNLFSRMGLETKLTRSSKDGGVDAIAFDTRPVLGGKVVIQAKRYRNTVGVSAVRDLYGTMLNEGASKGILVTTSSYGPDAYKFSDGKPMELIDGGGLLYLLQEVGVRAKIIIPQE